AVLERSGGGSLDSSTPGPPLGEPLTATTSVLPSGMSRTPRGRCPGLIVRTTLSVRESITVTLCPSSSLTYTSGPVAVVAALPAALPAAFVTAAVLSDPAAFCSPPLHAASAAHSATAETAEARMILMDMMVAG